MRAERSWLLLAIGAVAALAARRPAQACGPDFPPELLSDRGAAVAGLPEGIFVDEAAALVPAHEAWRPRDVVAPAPTLLEGMLYRAGAVAFHAGQREEAARWFRAVLALPPSLRRALSTSAAFSLGRLNVAGGGVAAYRQVRALVDAGYVDPDGLAAASLWMEAWLSDGRASVELLAQSAALGRQRSVDELLAVVRDAIAEGREATLLDFPVGQRLIAAYLYARDGELAEAERARLWQAIAARPQLDGADRLAAAAYRGGDWARAELLVARASDTAIARWVRGKLAARAGDPIAASDLVCSAAAALPATTACPDFRCGDYLARDRALAECATLRLAADQPVEAMRAAWAARRRYRDAIYIAERVLSLDELGAFVATIADAPRDDAPASPAPDLAVDDYQAVDAASLRALYGRRLMRTGRIAEALRWLPLEERVAAASYGAGRALAADARDPIARAAWLFAASKVARTHGLEILGTEHAPDWATWGGDYDVAAYTSYAFDDDGDDEGDDDGDDEGDDDDRAAADDDATTDAPLPIAQPTALERARVAGSAPRFDERWHYRVIATGLARDAAALVPLRSQARAALRCWADGYATFAYRACPEPDFVAARHTRDTFRGVITPHRHPRWMRRIARRVRAARAAVPWAALAALVAIGALIVVRRGPRRPAMRP
ncbi:MAG: hypothetical protein JNK64_40830 [Myxococcales bacterium]|nr:hypothetical protein [Myxococcales bacterium]